MANSMRNFQFLIPNFQKNRGFTLVETLVAITVLLMAVTGAYTAAQTGLSSAIYSRDEVVAAYLAQEGIEQIRNMRDENGISGRSWLTGIAAQSSDACYFGSTCTVDAIANALYSCGGTVCPPVREDATNGFYGYDASWTATPFVRTITLTEINPDEVQVVSTVTWSKGLSSRTFRVRENIMNWQ